MAIIPDINALGARPAPKPNAAIGSYDNTFTHMEQVAGKTMEETGQANTREGSALINLGEQIKKEQYDVDAMRAEDAFNKMREQQMDLTLGQTNGFKNLHGVNALQGDIIKNWGDRFDLAQQGITDTLQNDQQKALFAKRAGVARNQFTHDMLVHVAGETENATVDTFKATLDTERRVAGVNWNKPLDVATSMQRTDAAITQFAQSRGLNQVETDDLRMKAQAGIHADVIAQSVAAGNMPYAKAWFDAHKNEIDAHTSEMVSKVMLEGKSLDDTVTVQRALETMGGSFKDKYAALNNAFDNKKQIAGIDVSGEMYKQLKSAIEHDEMKAKQSAEQYSANAIGAAQDYFIRNPDKNILDFAKENPGTYQALKSKGHLGAFMSTMNEPKRESDPTIKFNVVTHMGDGSPLDVTKLPDSEWFNFSPKLSQSDFDKYTAQRAALNNSEPPKGENPANTPMGLTKAIDGRITSIGINPSKAKNVDDKERINAIRDYAQVWVLQDQKAQGTRFNSEQLNDSLDRLFAKDVEFRKTLFPGSGIGGYNPELWSTNQKMMGMKFTDIPAEAVTGIRKALTAKGNSNPTQRDILETYWKLHGK